MSSQRRKTYMIRVGLVLSAFIFFEVSLILFGSFFNRSALYRGLRDGAEDTTLEINNVTLETYNSLNSHELVCFGDSFTNGGNVFKESSYPYQLWKKLDKKYTVRNVGICEQPTSDALRSIEHFIKSDKYNLKKKYSFLLLSGAANVFTDHLDLNKLNKEFRIKQKWKNITDHEEGFVNFIKKSKLISLSFFVSDLLKNNMISDFIELSYTKDFRDVFNICFYKDDSSLRQKCFRESMPSQDADHLEEVIYTVADYFSKEDIKPFKRASLLLEVLEVFPMIGHHFEFTSRLLANLRRQSRIPYTEALSRLEKALKDSQDVFDVVNKNRMGNVFSGSEKWLNKIQMIDSFQEDWLDQIVQLIKPYKNINLVLMTYPISYIKLNESIRKIASKYQIKLIDLEKVFESRINNSKENLYITDWQHCTPKGYKLIADTVKESLGLLEED
jgi:hypothetical protein